MADEDPETVKACCTSFYESDIVRRVLGDAFHPGGERMTLRLGNVLELGPDTRVLDVACGTGGTTIALAKGFGCHVTGMDLGSANLERARARAEEEGVAHLTEFLTMDAEALDFPDGSFDAVVSECALCTFTDQPGALAEVHRVLRPGGTIGITDVIVERELPERARTVLFQVACISGAMPRQGYVDALEAAGFSDISHEDHSYAVAELLDKAERMLAGWRFAEQMYGVDLEAFTGMTQEEAGEMLAGARGWVDAGDLGYGLFTGSKPPKG
ncbi:MAG: methyltransferase domain-containing protein [Thermoplasmata archaeon]|nr:MAG: methyltransferase domain-containing protein [Thermoplasmata archaeon]